MKTQKIDKKRIVNFLMDDVNELTKKFDRVVNCSEELTKNDCNDVLQKLWYLESLIVKLQK